MAFSTELKQLSVYDIDKKMQIIITEVESTTKFWFNRKGKDYHEALETVHKEMNDVYNNDEMNRRLCITQVKPGLPVAAKYDESGYNRGIIRKINRINDTVQIFFCDFGTLADIEVGKVRLLYKQFRVLPMQALHGRLWGLKERKEDNKAFNRVLQLVSQNIKGFEAEIKVKRLDSTSPWPLYLESIETGRTLNMILAKEKICHLSDEFHQEIDPYSHEFIFFEKDLIKELKQKFENGSRLHRFFENKEMQIAERIELEINKEPNDGNAKICDNHEYNSDIDIPVTEDSIKKCEKESTSKAVNEFEDVTIVSNDGTDLNKNNDTDPKLIIVKDDNTTTEVTKLRERNTHSLKNASIKYDKDKQLQFVERIQLKINKEPSVGNSKIYDKHTKNSDIDIPVTEDSMKKCEKESIIKAVNDFEDITSVSNDITELNKKIDTDPKLITVKDNNTTTDLTKLTEITKDSLKNSPTKYDKAINSSLPFHEKKDPKYEQTSTVSLKESIQKKLLLRNYNSSKSRRTEIIERFKSLKKLSKPLEDVDMNNKEENSQGLKDKSDKFTEKIPRDFKSIDNIKPANKVVQNISKDPDLRIQTADKKSKEPPLGNQKGKLQDGISTGLGATDTGKHISQIKSNEKSSNNSGYDPNNRRRTYRNRYEQPDSDMFRWHPMDNDMVWIPASVPVPRFQNGPRFLPTPPSIPYNPFYHAPPPFYHAPPPFYHAPPPFHNAPPPEILQLAPVNRLARAVKFNSKISYTSRCHDKQLEEVLKNVEREFTRGWFEEDNKLKKNL